MPGGVIDRPLADVFIVPDRQCPGHLDKVERTIPGANGGFRVMGWARDDEGSVPPAVVLVEDGIVKGIGRFILDRPVATRDASDAGYGFVGYVPHGVRMIKAYTLSWNKISACRLPGDLPLPPGGHSNTWQFLWRGRAAGLTSQRNDDQHGGDRPWQSLTPSSPLRNVPCCCRPSAPILPLPRSC